MKSTPMRREFSFHGLKLPDPNPQMSVEDVRGVLSMQYPEIATAAIRSRNRSATPSRIVYAGFQPCWRRSA